MRAGLSWARSWPKTVNTQKTHKDLSQSCYGSRELPGLAEARPAMPWHLKLVIWHIWVHVGPCGLLLVIWHMCVLVGFSLLFGTCGSVWVLVGFSLFLHPSPRPVWFAIKQSEDNTFPTHRCGNKARLPGWCPGFVFTLENCC